MDLNVEAARVHAANSKWWTDLETGQRVERNEAEMFALMASEISEALEGERKSLLDDKLPEFPMACVEMVDVAIRVLDYCGAKGYELRDEREIVRENWMIGRVKAEMIWDMHCALVDTFWSGDSSIFSMLIAMARIYCERQGYDFDRAYEAKLAFNATRADHTIEARKAPNGKKF